MKEGLERLVNAAAEGMQRIHRIRGLENRRRALQMERTRLANRATQSAGGEDLAGESHRIQQEEAALEDARGLEVDALVRLLDGVDETLSALRGEVEAVLEKEKAGALCEEGENA